MHSSQFGITFTDSRGPVNSDGPIHCIRSLNRMVRYSVMPLPATVGGGNHNRPKPTTLTGPNDARCIVWALGLFLNVPCIFNFFITTKPRKAHSSQQRPTKANAGPGRPTAANDGQRRPTKGVEGPQQLTMANEGQRRPRKAHSSQRRPTKAHKDEKGPMTWTGEMGRVMAGARDASPRYVLNFFFLFYYYY